MKITAMVSVNECDNSVLFFFSRRFNVFQCSSSVEPEWLHIKNWYMYNSRTNIFDTKFNCIPSKHTWNLADNSEVDNEYHTSLSPTLPINWIIGYFNYLYNSEWMRKAKAKKVGFLYCEALMILNHRFSSLISSSRSLCFQYQITRTQKRLTFLKFPLAAPETSMTLDVWVRFRSFYRAAESRGHEYHAIPWSSFIHISGRHSSFHCGHSSVRREISVPRAAKSSWCGQGKYLEGGGAGSRKIPLQLC